MTKTLKDFLEVYKPKSPDEQKFVDKHVTIKHKDRNGNGDDVFNGNTKYIKRKEERHGYDVGDDEKVYEEVEDVEEARIYPGDYHVTSEKSQFGGHRPKVVHKDKGHTMYLGQHAYKKPAMAIKHGEAYLTAYAARGDRAADNASIDFARANKKHLYVKEDVDIEAVLDETLDLLMSIDEKTLTSAEMKKREEVVKAIKRENPEMDKSMAYAIATKTAKRVAEGKIPTADEPTEHDKKMAQKVRDLLAKEKKPVKEEAELDEAAFAPTMRKAIAAHERGDHKRAKYHLDNAKTARYAMKSTEISKHKDLLDKYKELRALHEEVEDLDESVAKVAQHLIKRYGENVRKSHVRSAANDFGVGFVALSHHVRKKLGVNRLEEEQIDELSVKKLTDYTAAASDARRHRGMPTAKLDNRYKGVMRAGDKINKGFSKVHATEEVEVIDELSKKTLGSYAVKASRAAGSNLAGAVAGGMSPGSNTDDVKKMSRTYAKRMQGVEKAVNKLTKEDIINRSIDKYVPEEAKFTPEERLLKRLDGLSEAHVNTLLGLFEALNKDNQNRMIETVETREGINQLLNFALDNRGE